MRQPLWYVVRELILIALSLLAAVTILYTLFGGQLRGLKRAAAAWLTF